MITEDQQTDLKSLRIVTGKTIDWGELAKDCACFANARGGRIRGGAMINENKLLPKPLSGKISVSAAQAAIKETT